MKYNRSYGALLLSVVIFASSTTRMSISGVAAYSVTLATLAISSLYVIFTNKKLVTNKTWLLSISGIFFIYVLHGFQQPYTTQELIRLLVFPPVALVTMWITAYLADSRDIVFIFSRIGSLFAITSLLPLFIGEINLGPVSVSLWEWGFPYPFPFERATMGLFINPNSLGLIAGLGCVCSVILADREANTIRLNLLLSIFCGFSVLASASRAAIIATIIGLGIASIFPRISASYATFITIIGIVSVVIIVGIISLTGHVPGGITLTGREKLWPATIEAAARRPLVGYGTGDTGTILSPFLSGRYSGFTPHNSYYRLLLTTGFAGFVCYLIIHLSAIVNQLRRFESTHSVGTLPLLIYMFILELFASFSLFGLSFATVVAAIIVGNTFHGNVDNQSSSEFPL
ncbi:hypothetical protein EXE43_07740 [Halorubrum sp. SS5]|nr:hypothetical protein EXE43_07740 [Halorubrum sp. SS5]